MKAVRLHGPRDLRLEEVSPPGAPGLDEALIQVKAVGICGSDLHMYLDGRIGDTRFESPLVIGHEFMGEVVSVGQGARDGNYLPLTAAQRVAVEPHIACHRCETCETGNPNLCPHHTFIGVYPTNGALQEYLIVPARNCFPIPLNISDGAGTLLETLGVALHAVDLGKLRAAQTVAVIGCGPVGLLIIMLAKLSGADRVYAFDRFPWRVEMARRAGAIAWQVDEIDPRAEIAAHTNWRGVDVAFEAAWADHTVQWAADFTRPGGRVVLVGIPGDDRLSMQHAVARRKGLTVLFARRMKHTYPRAIHLAESGLIDLDRLISHHVPLADAPAAFARNVAYETDVHKIVVQVGTH